MTLPPSAYDIGDILVDIESEGTHYIVEDIEWMPSVNMYLYMINCFEYNYWESESILTKWARRVA